jgi:uncharacterized protein involved in type VI secretion and phage assembly
MIGLGPPAAPARPPGPTGSWFGAHVALVADLVDPDNLGRVLVQLPWAPDTGVSAYRAWARLATTMAGNQRGTWMLPDVGDEVLVVFEAGDPRRPYVVGGLWNGADRPPDTMDKDGRNNRKRIRSRRGVQILLDDSQGAEALVLETPGGRRITLEDGATALTVEDRAGNRVRLDDSGIAVTAAGKVTVQASGNVEVTAGMLKVDATTAKFSGTVKAQTFIADTVVGTSYTPGAGNTW